MNPKPRSYTKGEEWDKAAPYYETGWEEQLWPVQEKLLEVVDPQPGEVILDVACGTGLVSLPLANLILPYGQVTGIDISDKMLEKAGERTEKEGIKNVVFHRMDAEELNLHDNTFDKVVCSLGLMYFPHPDKALDEILRVLKPEGQLAVMVWGDRKNCGWSDFFPNIEKRVKSIAYTLYFQLGTGRTLHKAFEKAWFNNIISNRFTTSMYFKDSEEAFSAIYWGGVLASVIEGFDKPTLLEVKKEYLRSIQSYRNGNSYNIPGEFVIVRGEKG